MTKFKNIKFIPVPTLAPVKAVPSQKQIGTGPKDSPPATLKTKTSVRSTGSMESEGPAKTGSKLGLSVMVLSFVVVVQIVLLLSLIYLSPMLVH